MVVLKERTLDNSISISANAVLCTLAYTEIRDKPFSDGGCNCRSKVTGEGWAQYIFRCISRIPRHPTEHSVTGKLRSGVSVGALHKESCISLHAAPKRSGTRL